MKMSDEQIAICGAAQIRSQENLTEKERYLLLAVMLTTKDVQIFGNCYSRLTGFKCDKNNNMFRAIINDCCYATMSRKKK